MFSPCTFMFCIIAAINADYFLTHHLLIACRIITDYVCAWNCWDSGRLHPLWPQNKRLHTPWIKITRILDKIDVYRLNWLLHLQRMPQNRIPLKSYHYRPQRKENDWKTEETLARAVVTLQTERIKGTSPWCLWWWLRLCSVRRNTKFFLYSFDERRSPMAVPLLSRLFAGQSTRRPDFDPLR
jgi:hypothetical protein